MLSFDQALDSVSAILKGMSPKDDDFVILSDETLACDFGWVFFYNSRRFLETGDLKYLIAGNAPLIFDKYSGSICATGTAEALDEYLKRYRLTGNPHSVQEPKVKIIARRDGANKVQLTKLIKAKTGLGLKQAKEHTDAVASGGSTVVELASIEDVATFIQEIESLGFDCEKVYRDGTAYRADVADPYC